MNTPSTPGSRLISLDALRGFTILGMIIVNSPGNSGSIYEPLQHASWHGMTPTDLVFPFFLFIMGVSVALSHQKQLNKGTSRAFLYKRLCVRVIKIFLVGVFLNLWYRFDFENIRIAGVLQRIAIVFGVCAFLYIKSGWRLHLTLLGVCLFGYWIVLSWVPVPMDAVNQFALEHGTVERSYGTVESVTIEEWGDSFLSPNIEPGTNLASWIDRHFLPGRAYEIIWDPEGVLSTIPAIGTGLLGMLIGSVLLMGASIEKRLNWLFLAGCSCLLAGEIWSWAFPYNKNLWSSSFVLASGGMAMLGLAVCILLVDEWGWKKWTYIGQVFGANAIVAYALSGMLKLFTYHEFAGQSFHDLFIVSLQHLGMPDKMVSLSYALTYTALIFIPVYILYRKKIFIRL